MNIAYADKITHNSRLFQFVQQSNHDIGFIGFKNYWHSIPEINSLFNENIFKQVIANNLNQSNNKLIHNFIMNEAKLFFRDKFSEFEEYIRDFTFKSAIQEGHIENIQLYAPQELNLIECLQISIKYNSWKSFTWFLEQHIPEKEHKKTIQWTHKEFWEYRNSGYSSFEFFQQLVRHPLSQNKPLKQGVYNLIVDKNFVFVNQLLHDDQCLPLLNEINITYYYKLLLKKLSECRPDYEFNDGMILLKDSLQYIPFDFSNKLFNVQFEKENTDIVQLLHKAQLKQKLDLLPEKQSIKKIKI